MVNPVTVQVSGPVVQAHVAPPGEAVTVYPVIVDPPLEEGAVHETVTWPFPEIPDTEVGAEGGEDKVICEEGAEAMLVPAAFVAVTVKVYPVPFVNPVTVHVSGPLVHTQVAPPGDAVTV